MSNREHDPAFVEPVYCVQHTDYFWSCSYDLHTKGSVLVHEPVLFDNEVLHPVHLFERSKAFRGRSDE
jgi:hypothetical protein